MCIVSSDDTGGMNLTHYVCASLFMSFIFLLLLFYITLIDVPGRWEIEISQWFQNQRTPSMDRIMVYLTMTADWQLNVLIAIGLITTLFAGTHHWLAIHLTCICLSANIGVPLIKQLTERHRPTFVHTQLESFSFPSGHSCIAALSAGVIALLVAQDKCASVRIRIYSVALLYALTIAATRIYLSVHWMFDVIAGLVFAGILLPAFAWQLRQSDRVNKGRFSAVLVTLVIALAVSYGLLGIDAQMIHYGFTL